MNLYLVEQYDNAGYETYDSMVVCAESEEAARRTHPRHGYEDVKDWGYSFSGWCSSPDKATVMLIGVADASVKPGVVIASYNAG